MSVTEIKLADDEGIIRVFLRWSDEPWGFSQLRKADFARQMTNHSGMSMLRLKFLSGRDEALNWFESKKLKGLAICKAKQLSDLKLRFMASEPNDKHISVRCPPCNLEVDYPNLCQPTESADCLINLRVTGSISQKLCNIFDVDTPVKSP